LLYQAKPQRGGRSIPTNTNTPPQDPPPPPVDMTAPSVIVPVEEPIVDVVEIPEIVKYTPLIKIKPTPKIVKDVPVELPVPETVKPTVIPQLITPPKIPDVPVTFREKIISFFKRLFRRI